MKTYQFPQIDGCEVRGYLTYGTDDPECLIEDMLEIELPDGVLVAVGWFPEGSLNGRYKITARLGLSDVRRPIVTADVSQAAQDTLQVVENLKAGLIEPESNSETESVVTSLEFHDAYADASRMRLLAFR